MQGLKYMLAILFGWAMGLCWQWFIRWYGSEPKKKEMPSEEADERFDEDREFGDLLVKVALLFLAIIASLLLFALGMTLLLK